MRVSTKIFNQKQVGAFQRLQTDVHSIQEKISSGKKITKASDDPIGAVELSAVREQRDILTQYLSNSSSAATRLDLTDKTLDEFNTALTRLTELATMAGNGIYDGFGHESVLNEMKQLYDVCIGLANTSDSLGRPLFGGFNSSEIPFTKDTSGNVKYNGNRGQHSVQISESLTVNTGIDGGSAFMRIDTHSGRRSVFDIIKSTMNAVETAAQIKGRATGGNRTRLDFNLPSKTEKWTFTIGGNAGEVEISANIARNNLTELVNGINAVTGRTSVSASLDSDGTVLLTDITEGEILIHNISIEGQDYASPALTSYVSFKKLDGDLNQISPTVRLTDRDQLMAYNVGALKNSLDSINLQRSTVAAQISKNKVQNDVLESRKLIIDKDYSNLSDVDLAEMITKLQSQMTNLEASQAAFSKIGQMSLFDYLR